MDIRVIPYQLGKYQVSYKTYILLNLNSETIEYVFRNYNGVIFPSKDLIMLLGNKGNLNIEKWSQVINHEILHFVLCYLGIENELVSEQLVRLLEK